MWHLCLHSKTLKSKTPIIFTPHKQKLIGNKSYNIYNYYKRVHDLEQIVIITEIN